MTAVMSRMTPRDLTVIHFLGRHKVLTCRQVALMWFGSEQAARTRLNTLARLEVITRFRQCVRPGSQSYRYTLGPSGAAIHAAACDQPAPTRATMQRRLLALAASSHLNHHLGVNDFIARLHHAAARRPRLTLLDWQPAHEAAGLAAEVVRPDGAGDLHTDDAGDLAVWFEHDTGTRTLADLAAQITRYRRIPDGNRRVLLVELHSPRRETHLHAHLAHTAIGVTVATVSLDRSADPTAAIWRVLGRDPTPRHLAQLAP